MVWFEVLNSVACTLLLVAMLPLAFVVDPRRHPLHATIMVAAEIAFFLQIVTPMLSGMPPVVWQTAVLHTIQALCVLLFRRRLWQFARAELVALRAPHPMRRVSDVDRVASPAESG